MHWFYDPDISEHSEQIAKTELTHFKSLRISAGEEIVVTSGKGYGYRARVIDPETGGLAILNRQESMSDHKFHLVQAIAKGGRDESALQACTELGISSATALQAERSIARWDNKVNKNLERWTQIAVSATKQSQQHFLPEIGHCDSVNNLKPKGLGLVLDPRAPRAIAEIESVGEYTVVVGPEGGFSDGEISRLEANGFQRVRLGSSILRTSTAGVVAIACLQLISGQFGNRLV